MNENDLSIEYSDKNGYRVIIMPSSIDVYTHIEVKDKIIEILKDTGSDLILDMKNMDFIESSGISVVVTVQKLLESDNRKLFLSNINKDITEVMNYCKVPYNTI